VNLAFLGLDLSVDISGEKTDWIEEQIFFKFDEILRLHFSLEMSNLFKYPENF